jgi:hypothetical protein
MHPLDVYRRSMKDGVGKNLGGPTTHHLIVFIKIYVEFLKIKDAPSQGSLYSKQF